MRPCITLLAIALALGMPAAVTAEEAAATGGGSTAAAAKSLPWRGWDRGLEEARTSGRPVLVDVYTDWCGWCKRMKAEVYSKPEVRDYLKDHFVLIELNAEAADPALYEDKSYTSRSLAAHPEASGYPTTVFLRSGGEHLVSVPGYLEASKFLQVLRFIGDGHMEKGVSFKEFIKQPSQAHP